MFHDNLTGWKRTFWKYFQLSLMVLVLVNFFFHVNSSYDRGTIRDNQTKMENEIATVKDARARIQIKLVNAVADGRKFTPAEFQEIQNLWEKAEYNKIQERFLE